MHRLVTLLLTITLCTWSPQVLAWGRDGHQAVAAVAADLLTGQARKSVQELLGGDDAKAALEEISTWADEVRMQRSDSRRWHYVNIPISAPGGYNAARDCPKSDCIVGVIERFSAVLAARTLLPVVRAEALRWLVHFVADIHQPLHAGDNGDRGGNEVKVRVGGHTVKLHAWWDSDVVEVIGDRDEIVARLQADTKAPVAKSWASGTAALWASESARVSRDHAYGIWITGTGATAETIILPPEYVPQAAHVAEQQLAKAAVRLAITLNAAFR